MKKRSLFKNMFGKEKDKGLPNGYSRFKLLNTIDSSYTSWNGDIYNSDIVRSCLRPKAINLGKVNFKHIRDVQDGIVDFPDSRIKYLLKYPNRYMTMQEMLEKISNHRELNCNAYAFVRRDKNGRPEEIFPIPSNRCELLEYKEELYMKFTFSTGKTITIFYDDVIHLRKDFNNNDFYGDNGYEALRKIMNVIDTTDKGIVTAIKNSAVIKWIMKFKSVLNDTDRKNKIEEFVNNYLDVEKAEGNSMAATDPRYDVEQVKDNNYVPNADQMTKYIDRLYSYFGVNEKIVKNEYNEDQWNSFYEMETEPVAKSLAEKLTKTLFTKGEIEHGNQIVFEPSSLQYASMNTKLGLQAMVDRGAMTPNEWRNVLNLSPLEGGDEAVRRLDTAVVNQIKGSDKNE